ncbi:hypothetical protein ACHAW6_010477 [Cyclotella cf. meneghiniana]
MPTLETAADSEPSEAVSKFWATLRQPGHEIIAAATRQSILRSCPAINTFSFELIEKDLAVGAGPRESPVASVEAGTPRLVIEAWNQDKLVQLVVLNSGAICGAAVGNDVPVAARDFKACALPTTGRDGVKCGYGGHVGVRVKRLSKTAGAYFVGIPVPSGTGKVKLMFSRPILEEHDFFYLPRSSPDFSKLLSYQFEPRVWKTLLELFPGASILDPANDVTLADPPTSVPSLLSPSQQRPSSEFNMETNTPVSSAAIRSPGGDLGGFQVSEEPLILKRENLDRNDSWGFSEDERSGSGRASVRAVIEPVGLPKPKFEWDTPRSIARESSDSLLSPANSVPCSQPSPTEDAASQVLQELKARMQVLEVRELEFLEVEKAREKSLAEKFHSIESENAKLRKKLREMQHAMHELERTHHAHSSAAPGSYSLDKRDLDRVIREVRKDLDVSQYVRRAEVTDAMERAAVSHTEGIMKRMEAVEHEVFNNAGIAPQLLMRVQAFEASKAVNSIEMGGMSLWTRPRQKLGDALMQTQLFIDSAPTLFHYSCWQSLRLGQMSAVVKANFQSIDEATISLSYSITYPPRIIRASDKQEAQETDGFTWAPPFVTFEAFEGSYHNGTRMRLKKSLDAVAKAIESGIDFHFPIATRPLSNAVFKAQCSLAHRHACEFLESLAPLYKQFSGGGMSSKDSWSRVMVFARQIFTDIASVRALNSEGSLGSMIWASFRTTELLKEYQRHN